MSLRTSIFQIEHSPKWGFACAFLAIGGAVVLAKKVHSAFSKSLVDVTKLYLAFVNRIGNGEEFQREQNAKSLIASNCQKILNGKLYTKSREAFISDLVTVHQTQGCWTVTPLDIIDASQGNFVTMRLKIKMEKLGDFTAIVILRFNSNHLITEINEVLNKMDGSYNFDNGDK